jgi:hypothetical protein
MCAAPSGTAMSVRAQEIRTVLQNLLGEIEILIQVPQHGDVLRHLVGLHFR